MVNGKLFMTDYSLTRNFSDKIALLYDEKDSSILESDLINFCKDTSITNITKFS
jgi:hypothetical protein